MKKFCDEKRLVYLDYYTAVNDGKGGMKQGLAKDGIHPTAEGYAIMEPLADRAISEALRP